MEKEKREERKRKKEEERERETSPIRGDFPGWRCCFPPFRCGFSRWKGPGLYFWYWAVSGALLHLLQHTGHPEPSGRVDWVNAVSHSIHLLQQHSMLSLQLTIHQFLDRASPALSNIVRYHIRYGTTQGFPSPVATTGRRTFIGRPFRTSSLLRTVDCYCTCCIFQCSLACAASLQNTIHRDIFTES